MSDSGRGQSNNEQRRTTPRQSGQRTPRSTQSQRGAQDQPQSRTNNASRRSPNERDAARGPQARGGSASQPVRNERGAASPRNTTQRNAGTNPGTNQPRRTAAGTGATSSARQSQPATMRRNDDRGPAPLVAKPRAVAGQTGAAVRSKREQERQRNQRRQARTAERNRGPLGYTFSRKRVTAFGAIAATTATLLIGRLAWVQLINGPQLAEQARQLRTHTVELVAERGSITDRNGVAIAESVTRYKVFADQLLIENWKTTDEDGNEKGGPKYAAKLIAPLLGLNEAELAASLTKSADTEKYNQYLTIATDVAPETWQAVRELGIAGIFPETLPKRIYPSGETASNIIGWVGAEGGQSGLEYKLDALLGGKDGKMTYERSKNGYILPAREVTEIPAEQGQTIRSTLDMDIQWHAEQALDEQLSKMGASAGTVIVQDVNTCEVLALADRSTTKDGNTDRTGRVGAVLDVFEPGSTAKIITMAAAIETGVATPTSKFKVPYQYTTSNGEVFKDSHEHATQKMTLTGILADSSNTGTVQVGELLTKQVRYDYLKKFGFGERTGIELGGETRGILHDVDDWDGRTQYGVLFGQGVSASAVQATNAFSTIANDGQACQPHLVAGTVDSDGVFTESEKSETTQIVSKDTADKVLSMMESVVVEGSGKPGAVKGYRVAGKTGTAQSIGADGKLSSFVSSFIGVAPVEDPQIVVSVIIRDPKTTIWGSVVSAPVFSDVMAYSLQRLGIEPSTTKPQLYPIEWK